MSVRGWKLDKEDLAWLLKRFPPVWPDVIADHITLLPAKGEQEAFIGADQGKIVGHVNDGQGLQALVVEIEGTTIRPDGSIYHITWSIDRGQGRAPKDSNEVLARLGWDPLDNPLLINLIPATWP